MRVGLQILRGECRNIPGGRTGGCSGQQKFRAVPSFGSHFGGDALELSLLASFPFYRAVVDGWECRLIETCVQRAAISAAYRKWAAPGRICRRRFSDFADWFEQGGEDSGRSQGESRDADR